MKRFLTQVMRLFRKSKVGSQEVHNWLETARRGAWLGISWWLEGGAGLRVLSCMGWYLRCLNFSLATKEGAPRLSYQFSLMWDRRGRRIGVVGFGSDCHQTSKMELNLYYIYIYILFMWVIHRCVAWYLKSLFLSGLPWDAVLFCHHLYWLHNVNIDICLAYPLLIAD